MKLKGLFRRGNKGKFQKLTEEEQEELRKLAMLSKTKESEIIDPMKPTDLEMPPVAKIKDEDIKSKETLKDKIILLNYWMNQEWKVEYKGKENTEGQLKTIIETAKMSRDPHTEKEYTSLLNLCLTKKIESLRNLTNGIVEHLSKIEGK